MQFTKNYLRKCTFILMLKCNTINSKISGGGRARACGAAPLATALDYNGNSAWQRKIFDLPFFIVVHYIRFVYSSLLKIVYNLLNLRVTLRYMYIKKKLMAKVLLFAKYTFFVAIIFGAGVSIERITKMIRWKEVSEPLIQDDLIYNASSHPKGKIRDTILQKDYLTCLTNPSKIFCLMSSNKRVEIFQSDQEDIPNAEVIESRLQAIDSVQQPRKLQMYSMLLDYTRLMKSYDVKVILIEPTMLFCVLSSETKVDMVKKGFNPSRFQGSRNVVTVGILGEDSRKLEQANLTNEIVSSGYKIMKFRKWIGHGSRRYSEIVHYFIIRHDIAVHVVVFYPQNSYLWHASLDAKGVDLKDLLFVEEGIFENFILLPMNLENSSVSRLYLPYDIRYFLEDIGSSRLEECKGISSSVIPLPEHPSLTDDQLITRATIALKELRAIFVPEIMFFWLWSKTLLGWFTNCDIFQYSTSLQLAVMNNCSQGLNLTDLLADNGYLKVENSTDSDNDFQYRLNCHGLDINIFILCEDQDVLTYQQGDEQNATKLEIPKFPLCSTHVYGQKIHVPCNTDGILKLEYENGFWNSSLLNVTNQITFSVETGG